jgi:hypothetical protein
MSPSLSFERDMRPALIGYLPGLSGVHKTGANYRFNASLVNTGDLAYTYASTMLSAGRHFEAWDFSTSAEEVNEKYSKVIFFLPCCIAPPPYDNDGYPYERVTQFVEKLKIPFFSLAESVQSRNYDYETDFHKSLSPKVVRYLNVVADKSPVVGTRGYYSAEVLKRLGIMNAIPLGCSSLYVNGPRLKSSLLSPRLPRKGKVATCYSNYQGNAHSRIRDLLHLADSEGFHYVEQTFGLVPQALYYPGKVSSASIRAARSLYQDLPVLISLLRKGQVHYFTNYTLWKNFLGTMDFAFGARMHGLTPAVHAGVPATFIAHDARVREMCEFFSLPFVAERDLPERLSLEFFQSRCDYVAASAAYPQHYREFVQTLHQYGLGSNVGQDGEIVDPWEPLPDGQVAKEEMTVPPDDFHYLEQIIAIDERLPANASGSQPEIEALAQDWYLSRRANG